MTTSFLSHWMWKRIIQNWRCFDLGFILKNEEAVVNPKEAVCTGNHRMNVKHAGNKNHLPVGCTSG